MPERIRASDTVDVTVETSIDAETAARYFAIYRETFGDLATRAVARQLLHEDEFLEEMEDPRIMKYVARDDDGVVIGLSTLTRDLRTVPWISPEYFAHHFPEHTARDAVYYLGFTLVDRRRRVTGVFEAMLERMIDLVNAERGVCGYDLCAFNDATLGLGSSIERLLHRNADVVVKGIDVQSYYVVEFSGNPPEGPEPAGGTG